MVSYSGSLIQANGQQRDLGVEISEVVEKDCKFLVLLETLGKGESIDDSQYTRNIFCLNQQLQTIWRIEQAHEVHGEVSPFTGLWKEGDAVWAYNWNGGKYQIDMKSGQLGDGELMK